LTGNPNAHLNDETIYIPDISMLCYTRPPWPQYCVEQQEVLGSTLILTMCT